MIRARVAENSATFIINTAELDAMIERWSRSITLVLDYIPARIVNQRSPVAELNLNGRQAEHMASTHSSKVKKRRKYKFIYTIPKQMKNENKY